MDKIKSARELAMERTASIKADQTGDSRSAELEQHLKAARILAASYLEAKTGLERVKEVMERYPAAIKPAAQKVFIETVTRGLNLEHTDIVLEAILLFYPYMRECDLIDTVLNLRRNYEESLAAQRKVLEEGSGRLLRQDLADCGISGSAVAGINLDRSPLWRAKQAEIAALFDPKLEAAKNNLLKQFSESR